MMHQRTRSGSVSLLSLFKGLDVYRKVPDDLSKASIPGALVSLGCMMIISLLVLSEFSTYLRGQTESSMIVDAPRALEKLRIYLNITLPVMPCHSLSLDTEDAMGGGSIEEFGRRSLVKQPVQSRDSEGCMVYGYLTVSKVPGNIRVSTRKTEDSLVTKVNLKHIIHSLTFSDESHADSAPHWHPKGVPHIHYDQEEIEEAQVFGYFNPLDGYVKELEEDQKGKMSFEYYINVVPTIFEREDGAKKHTYQFTYNFNDKPTKSRRQIPAIEFKYEISPITHQIKKERGSFLHFLVRLCAIVGGVFTVSSLLAALFASITSRLSLPKKLA